VALHAVADQCAMGLDRAWLRHKEETRTAAQRLLATISGVDPSMDWVALARHSVNACATGDVDFCALYVREGHLVRRVALASQTYPGLADELVDHFPTPLGSAASNATAIRTGEETPVPERRSPEQLEAGSPAPGYADALSQTETGPGWVFPLHQRGVTFGSMLFLARAGHQLDADTVDLMRAAAERTANLLISASAFAEQRAAIEALHEVVLPGDLSGMNGFDIAARYVPLATTGTIGGDWWDALPLPDGRLAIAVGDVAGHGVQAAAVMGQLRNALRMALVSRREPAEALGELSRFLDWIEPAAHCTAIAATADAANGHVTWTSAGHPPPLVIAPNRAPAFLASVPAPPLGVVGRDTVAFSEQVVELERGAILVLYTDGLVEGRGRPIDDGMRQLAEVAAGITADEPLDALADRILAALVDRPDDDVCLLVVRRP
jgi:serine phosphatase RsbU (regulator of sigma subunit)